jgi:glycosyltransferase involved in cell wall biosynthesis
VVDDGSSDDTQAVAERHGGALTFLRQPQRGPGAARNAGAQRAHGTYLAFLDSDDVWFPWTLAVYAQVISQAGQPAFIAGTPRYFSAPADLGETLERTPQFASFADYLASHDEWRWWGASAFVIRRDVFEAVGGFTDRWINGEDADLAMRLGAAPGFVQVTVPETFGYRRHSASEMANFDRTLAGAWHMVNQECQGAYPGGRRAAPARRQILARHLRSVMLEAVRNRRAADAWRMYASTFAWHVGQRRWRFLLAFPAIAMRKAIGV